MSGHRPVVGAIHDLYVQYFHLWLNFDYQNTHFQLQTKSMSVISYGEELENRRNL
jgi:hypothetical protein